MDVQKLERELSRFGGDEGERREAEQSGASERASSERSEPRGSESERRAVARAAGDLAASGRYATDFGAELDAETVLAELADARDGSPADRWNWWLGALEVAYGGYREFQVERWSEG